MAFEMAFGGGGFAGGGHDGGTGEKAFGGVRGALGASRLEEDRGRVAVRFDDDPADKFGGTPGGFG